MKAVGRIGWIQIDCPDPLRLAAFWSEVLGVGIDGRLGSPPQFVNLARQSPDAPHVSFQRVPEDDFREYGYSWRTMADPEGNEFCLIYDG